MAAATTTTSTFTDSTAPAFNTRARAVTSVSTAEIGLSPKNVAMNALKGSPSSVASAGPDARSPVSSPVYEKPLLFEADAMSLLLKFMEQEREREREKEREREQEREREREKEREREQERERERVERERKGTRKRKGT